MNEKGDFNMLIRVGKSTFNEEFYLQTHPEWLYCLRNFCLPFFSLSLEQTTQISLEDIESKLLNMSVTSSSVLLSKKNPEAFVRAENDLYSSVHHHITLSGTQKSQLKQAA